MNASAPTSSALDEEIARAEIYGLLAHLYYAPPTPEMLTQLRYAVTEAPMAGALLEHSWRAVVGAARADDDATLRAEYDALFGGMGKPEVYLFGSHYLTGFLNEKPLVGLRNDLAELGLERSPTMFESEDHIACLCEVMRYLIAGDDVAVANLTRQRRFFGTHIQPWADAMCDAIASHPKARFYAALARFSHDFFNVEAQGFDILN
jgi:TorA maturation chaperone TorD